MKIICPQCAFERDVPSERLPSASAIATCPQCQCRFRVVCADVATASDVTSTQDGVSIGNENMPHDSLSHDPLPPGAHIPKHVESAFDNHITETEAYSTTHKESAEALASQSVSTTPQDIQDIQECASGTQNVKDIRHDGDNNDDVQAASAHAQQDIETQDSFLHNPWESPEKDGYFAAFYQTAIAVLFAAPRFFAGLMPQGSRKKAFIFYLIVGILQVCIERLWSYVLSNTLATSVSEDIQLQSLLHMLSSQNDIFFAILLHTALSSLEILMASLFYFLVFKLIAPTQANYPLVFQVIAYSSAPLLLCIVPMIGSVVGILWSIACTFVGCRHALRLTWAQTIIGIMPLYLLGLLSFFHIMNTIQGSI